jgi:hypothetical protein
VNTDLFPREFVPELNTKKLGNSPSFLTITHMTLSARWFRSYSISMIEVAAEFCSGQNRGGMERHPKRHFKGYNRVCKSSFSHVRNILFALEENAVYQCSKPEGPSMTSNPHRFGPPTGSPHWHRWKEEADPHPHTGDSTSKA